jgi:hypothetical protein
MGNHLAAIVVCAACPVISKFNSGAHSGASNAAAA